MAKVGVMTSFDREQLKVLSAEMKNALQEVADRFGLSVELLGGKFTATEFTSRVQFGIRSTDTSGRTLDVNAVAFKNSAVLFGLKPAMLFGTFVHGRKTFQIIGLQPRRRANPVLGKDTVTGKTFIFPVSAVLDAVQLKRFTYAK